MGREIFGLVLGICDSMLDALLLSLEWRLIALAITVLLFWVAGQPLRKATFFAIQLHIVLFFAHSMWLYLRVLT